VVVVVEVAVVVGVGVVVMFLKLKEFGGISFRPEESVSLYVVHVGRYLVVFGLYTAI
jgi:hypothetical protein